MSDDLFNTFAKLLVQEEEIKQLGNSKIILQSGDMISQFSEESFRTLADNVQYDAKHLLCQFKDLKKNEYIVAAYHDGKLLGTRLKL